MIDYWEGEWKTRIEGRRHPKMNIEKMAKLIYELTIRGQEMADMEKLEIGCGPCIHARHLANIFTGWREFYTGIDLSQTAIEYAKESGFNAIRGDFFTHDFGGKKFNCFLFLDSLEHIFDHEALAEKMLKVANPEGFMVFGNVPLFCQAHLESVERKISLNDIMKFSNQLGLEDIEYEIYGANGVPFMRFTAL